MSWHDLFDGSDAHLLPSGIAECADCLRRHNAWRRGDDSIEASDPRELGLNIEFAIAIMDAIAGHDAALSSGGATEQPQSDGLSPPSA